MIKNLYKEIFINYKKIFFYFTSILLINSAIYAHPINYYHGDTLRFDFSSIVNIIIYLVFIVNFFHFIKSRFINKNNNKANNTLIIFFLIFLTQMIGSLSSKITNPLVFLQIGHFSLFYFVNVATCLLIIFNILNEKNKNLIKLATIFQLLILFIIFIIILYLANPFYYGYGNYTINFKIPFFNDDRSLNINSNGIGKLATIFCLIFYNFLLQSKNNITKFSFLFFSIILLTLILVTEGRLNFLLIFIGLVLSTIFHKSDYKNKYLLFLVLILVSQILYSANVQYRVERVYDLNIKYDEIKYSVNYIKDNSHRLTSNLQTNNPFAEDDPINKAKKEEIRAVGKLLPSMNEFNDYHEFLATPNPFGIENENEFCAKNKYIDNDLNPIKGLLTNERRKMYLFCVVVNSDAIKIGAPKFMLNSNDQIEKEYPILKKTNDYTNGRLYKWIIIFHRNISIFFGSGSQMDRLILYDPALWSNNDAAGSLPYMYAAGGIFGVLSILLFKIVILYKYLINRKKINLIRSNLFSFLSLILLIIIFIRSIFENSYAVWGVDFLIVSFALMNLIFYQNNIKEK